MSEEQEGSDPELSKLIDDTLDEQVKRVSSESSSSFVIIFYYVCKTNQLKLGNKNEI